jgi:hypothetical protein
MSPLHRITSPRGILTFSIAAAALWFYTGYLAPLQRRNQDLADRLAVLKRASEHTQETMRRAINLEAKANDARAVLNRRFERAPGAPPEDWLPEIIRAHLRQSGFALGAVRSKGVQEEPGLPGYRRAPLAIGIPIGDDASKAPRLLVALAVLEDQQKNLRVTDFEIRPTSEDAPTLEALMNVETLIRE